MTERILKTGVDSLDELAPFREKMLIGIFGQADIGKSFFSGQLASMCNLPEEEGGFGRPALIIDTEGFWLESTVEKIKKIFKARLGIEPRIDVYRARGEKELFELFNLVPVINLQGQKVEAQVYKKEVGVYSGKKKVGEIDSLEGSIIFQRLTTEKYGLLVIDSLSDPLKSIVAMSKSQNRTARSDLLSPFLRALQSVAEQFSIPVVVTNHISVNPESKKVNLWGGLLIDYTFKSKILIAGLGSKYPDNLRKFVRVRYPMTPDQDFIIAELKRDYGFVDWTPNRGKA